MQEKYDSALNYYYKVLSYKSITENQKLHILADIAEAYTEAKKINNIQHVKFFSKILYEAYLASNDYKNAVNYHVIYKAYYDSMVSEEKNAALLKSKIRFETEQVDAENSSLKQQEIISQQTIRFQNRFMTLLIPN